MANLVDQTPPLEQSMICFPTFLARRRSLTRLLFSVCIIVTATPASAQSIIHISPTQGSLQTAINTVPGGGIIELESGTYSPPPGGGWSIISPNDPRGFTIRAASGALPVLDAGGANQILTSVVPQPVTFQGLTFANGNSNIDYRGGAISIDHAQTIFVGCTFQNNSANGPVTGGGGLWIASSTVLFESCTFINNTSTHYGGAFSAEQSRVFVRDSQFIGNRVNLPGHAEFSAGGAIHGNASTIQLDNSRFENNQAGYVGGALYIYGPWQDPVTTPNMYLIANNCLFTGNFVQRDPNGTATAPTAGGAIQFENQAKGIFRSCRFVNNSAKQGGAIASYRSETEFHDSVFQNNQALGTDGPDGFGGAIFSLSDDNPDESTVGGTINRPSARLALTDCLIRGPGDGTSSARQGGGIFADGDLHSMYGQGVNQNGTAEVNRGIVNLTRVVFSDLNSNDPAGNGTGGALTGVFINLNANQCITRNCSTSLYGGAMEFVWGCNATITNSTFFRNIAGSSGGALTFLGGNLVILDCSFLDNRINASFGGEAIMTVPDVGGGGLPPIDMTGMIQNCVFSGGSGNQSMIYDGYRFAAPVNRLQFGDNQFSPSNQNTFFFDTIGFKSVAQVNGLTITFQDNSSCVKAPQANAAPGTIPVTGAILMTPSIIASSGAPGETLPLPSFLTYASSGGAASLDGIPQSDASGIAPTLVNRVHSLQVGSSSFSTVSPAARALNISTRLPAGTGQSVLIGGFIIQGPTPKNILIRAIGPSLPFAGVLSDPYLELHDSTGALIAANDNWRSTQIGGVIGADQLIDIQASALAPSNDAESAITATLDPGTYTAVVRGINDATGITVVEAYDLDQEQGSSLANISTRGLVQTGNDVMIGGFIIGGGGGDTRVVIRGIGPSLGSLGITNPLSNPMLELHDSNGTLIDSNDDWRTNQAAIQSTGLQPTNDAESAILFSNPAPGAYTAVLRGKNNGVGIGVVEAYVFQ